MATRPLSLGFPAITTPARLELRPIQGVVDNTRERFQRLEAAVVEIRLLLDSSTTAQAILLLKAQIEKLSAQVAALQGQAELAALIALFDQPDGIVVLKGGTLITRTLIGGGGITITYPDGFGGNPVITLAPPSAANEDGWHWAFDETATDFEFAA